MKMPTYLGSSLVDGHRQYVEGCRYFVPDPQNPGKMRAIEIVHELVIRLLPDEIEVTGDLAKWGEATR